MNRWLLIRYHKYPGLRLIKKQTGSSYVRFEIPIFYYKYKIQVHRKLFGITYWKTVFRCRNYAVVMDAYNQFYEAEIAKHKISR